MASGFLKDLTFDCLLKGFAKFYMTRRLVDYRVAIGSLLDDEIAVVLTDHGGNGYRRRPGHAAILTRITPAARRHSPRFRAGMWQAPAEC